MTRSTWNALRKRLEAGTGEYLGGEDVHPAEDCTGSGDKTPKPSYFQQILSLVRKFPGRLVSLTDLQDPIVIDETDPSAPLCYGLYLFLEIFPSSLKPRVAVAMDARRAAKTTHVFLSVGNEGLSSIIETEGNPDVHVILRGGSKGRPHSTHYESCMTDSVDRAKLHCRVC